MTSKRTFSIIRDSIVSALKERPMNQHELSVKTNTSFTTMKRHTEYLESIGIIRKSQFKLRKGVQPLWNMVRTE